MVIGGAATGLLAARALRLSQRIFVVVALLVLARVASAQRPVPDGVVSGGTLSFDGHASVGDFVGTTSAVTGQLTGGADLTAARGWAEAPVHSLRTGNEHRDRDLNKSMDSDRYPTIRFELTSISAGGVVQGDSVDATLHGTFTAHGVTHAVDVPIAIAFATDSITVRGQFPVNLKDYRIEGLSRLLGFLKMDEHILVHVALAFRPSGTASAIQTGTRGAGGVQ